MKKTNLFHSFRKKGAILLFLSLLFLGTFLPVTVNAHKAYLLTVTVNPSSKEYKGHISEDANSNFVDKHAEFEKTGVSFMYGKDGNSLFRTVAEENKSAGGKGPAFSLYDDGKDVISQTEMTSAYSTMFSSDVGWKLLEEGDYALPFTFPGRHVGTGASDNEFIRNGEQVDREQAMWVNSNLIGGLNQAISFVYQVAGLDENPDVQAQRLTTIATRLANAAAQVNGRSGGEKASTTFTINNKTITVASAISVPSNMTQSGLSNQDYVRIFAPGHEQILVPASVPKGYAKGQSLYETIKSTPYATKSGDDVAYLTWQHVVMQANYNYFVKKYTYSSVDQLVNTSKFEGAIATLFTSLRDGIESFLGLSSMSDMMLNRGNFKNQNWKGIMPKGLVTVADTLFVLVMIIAWLLISAAFVKLLVTRNLSAINPRLRVELKEGFMDIIITGFMLLMFIPIFRTMIDINESLVNMFGSFSKYSDYFGTAHSGSGNLLAPAIIGIAYLIMDIFFNFVYIMRSLTIAILYVFSPLFIVSISFGGKYKQIFGGYMKELVGAIFMQSIHAAVIGVYQATIDNGIGGSGLYQFVLILSFIPITNMFKGTILGLGGGAIDKVGAVGTGAAVTIGSFGAKFAGGAANGFTEPLKEKFGTGGGNGTDSITTRFGGGGGGGGGGGKPFTGDFGGTNDLSGYSETTVGTQVKDGISSAKLDRQMRGYNGGNKEKYFAKPMDKMADGFKNAKNYAGDAISDPSKILKDGSDLAKKHGTEALATGVVMVGKGLKEGAKQAIPAVAKAGLSLGDSGIDGVGNMEHSLQMKAWGLGKDSHHKSGKGFSGFSSPDNGGSGSPIVGYVSPAELKSKIPDEDVLDNFIPDSNGQGHLVTMEDNLTGDKLAIHENTGFENAMGTDNIHFSEPSNTHPTGSIITTYSAEQVEGLQYGNLLKQAERDFKEDGLSAQFWNNHGIHSVIKNDRSGQYSVVMDNHTHGIKGATRSKNKVIFQREQNAESKLMNFNESSSFSKEFMDEWSKLGRDPIAL